METVATPMKINSVFLVKKKVKRGWRGKVGRTQRKNERKANELNNLKKRYLFTAPAIGKDKKERKAGRKERKRNGSNKICLS